MIPRLPRELQFDDKIPVYWAGGHVFKSRFFDAFSTTLPEGEKFFIVSLRQFKDELTRPELQQAFKDFARQEGAHGMLHNAYNARLQRQGVDIPAIDAFLKKFFALHTRLLSPRMQITLTACAEHLTASMAHSILDNDSRLMDGADKRVRALYYWHAAEEIEHKSVAFDVMRDIAKVGYVPRVVMMVYLSVLFNALVLPLVEHVLRVDGCTRRERVQYWTQGLWWLFKPTRGGFFRDLGAHYLAWFKPGFEPWAAGELKGYDAWLKSYAQHGDALAAGEETHAQLAKAA
ncbi:metal-dependent hydrolase [Algiphilus sp. W345]|uniref:Metal-dependent hydrolase n=1 Tax=Banduia mediterranea TaxID=3075609 RepID=A0ABU2WEC9_9GAMM|nr:metal-dependent hydrolase [Algiphilus sp. W345]MDT0496219.1 metal-dependent hydrolase [Algiphilus sp. W345]